MMNRRQFMQFSLTTATMLTIGGTAWVSVEPQVVPLDIDSMITLLDKVMISHPVANGEWDVAQILQHCAQSVEYSMLGYPQHKSDLFKVTLGSLAFAMFESKRKMSHNLSEPIPGAAILDKHLLLNTSHNLTNAYARFKQSLIDFRAYDGVLAPHFAYGALTKKQYELAHGMHFMDHLLEVELR